MSSAAPQAAIGNLSAGPRPRDASAPLDGAPALPRRRLQVGFVLSVVWLAVVALAAIGAKWLPIQSPLTTNLLTLNAGPSAAHWLGTDGLGRDTLARLVYGAQVDAIISVGSGAIALAIGATIGMVAGYFRGYLDLVLMRIVDVILAFPGLVLALALVAFLGPSLRNLVLVIGIVAIPAFARIARASTLSVAQREFVVAARILGERPRRILRREILPNIVPALTTFLLLFMGIAIAIEGGLSFLGLGVPNPDASWGSMISSSLVTINTDPELALFPSAAMFLTILSLNFVSERLQARTPPGRASGL